MEKICPENWLQKLKMFRFFSQVVEGMMMQWLRCLQLTYKL